MNTLDKIARSPSQFDSGENYMGAPFSTMTHLHVVLTRNRDSSLLSNHNFDEALTMLGGESEHVEVHSFNHWACGWWEALCVSGPMIPAGQAIVDKLEIYPILNEDSFSMKEYDAAQDYWASLRLKDRVELCQEGRVSVFAARHDWIPSDDSGYIFERCRPD